MENRKKEGKTELLGDVFSAELNFEDFKRINFWESLNKQIKVKKKN